MRAVELFGKRTLGAHLLLDFLDVIEIIGGVDVRQSDRGNVRDDLVGRHTQMLMPHHDVEHTDAVAGDAGFPAAGRGPVPLKRGNILQRPRVI